MMIKEKSTLPCLTLKKRSDQVPFNKHNDRTKHTLIDWLWTCIFILSFSDVVLSYFGQSINLPRPWVLIIILFSIASIFSFRDFSRIKPWILISSLLLFISLLLGTMIIDIPKSILSSNNEGLTTVKTNDIITLAAAFFIGAIWALRQNKNAYLATDVLLFVSAIHTAIIVIALLKVYPSLFPIIDMPYFKNGIMISRPEITTDQTRQVLYLFVCLCVVFIHKSYIRLFISMAVSLAIIYIVLQVQSRWSAILFSLYIILAYMLAIYYKTQTKYTVIFLIVGGSITIVSNLNEISLLMQNLVWRFGQAGSGYGGRLTSILYMFEKLADPGYWLPQGYASFYNTYKQAPHSFPTMIYLNAGFVGLVSYVIVAFTPIVILLVRVMNKSATGIDKICFFMSSYAFLLLMTQPVITHEIFWLIAGLAAGSVSRNSDNIPQSSPENCSPRIVGKVPY